MDDEKKKLDKLVEATARLIAPKPPQTEQEKKEKK